MVKKVLFLCDKKNDWFSTTLISFVQKLNKQYKLYKFIISYEIPKSTYFDIVFFMNLTYKVELNKFSNLGLTLLIHESNLPKGRGFSPIQWQILEKKKSYKIMFNYCI